MRPLFWLTTALIACTPPHATPDPEPPPDATSDAAAADAAPAEAGREAEWFCRPRLDAAGRDQADCCEPGADRPCGPRDSGNQLCDASGFWSACFGEAWDACLDFGDCEPQADSPDAGPDGGAVDGGAVDGGALDGGALDGGLDAGALDGSAEAGPADAAADG